MGVSQVSSATKMLKAIWMSATDHFVAVAIGLTNSVQPYCRLAISTMQMMPTINCVQRCDGGCADCDIVFIDISHPHDCFWLRVGGGVFCAGRPGGQAINSPPVCCARYQV